MSDRPAPADPAYRGRYAPSPTGALHLGNARTAIVAWLRARAAGGALVLRVEDLDSQRSRPEHVAGNLNELRWLGLDWDEGPDAGGPHAPYLQSRRHDLYAAALARLEREGRTFRCWLSRRELREIASAPHGAAPVYGPAERAANARLRPAKEREGKTPSVRLRTAPGPLAFLDRLAGPQRFDAATDVGDTVVRRADGEWAYALAVVVDDAAMGIREVVRGDDLLAATAAQLLLYRALGLAPPAFLHVPLLLGADGERMAKRRGSATLAALREAGADPRRVAGALAASLGLVDVPRPLHPRELVAGFALERLTRTPAVWSAELDAFARGE